MDTTSHQKFTSTGVIIPAGLGQWTVSPLPMLMSIAGSAEELITLIKQKMKVQSSLWGNSSSALHPYSGAVGSEQSTSDHTWGQCVTRLRENQRKHNRTYKLLKVSILNLTMQKTNLQILVKKKTKSFFDEGKTHAFKFPQKSFRRH